MPKTLIPKTIELSEEEIKKIREKFPFVKPANIVDLLYWNDEHSPYSGTIIDEDAQFKIYPYPSSENEFSEEHPDGIIWK